MVITRRLGGRRNGEDETVVVASDRRIMASGSTESGARAVSMKMGGAIASGARVDVRRSEDEISLRGEEEICLKAVEQRCRRWRGIEVMVKMGEDLWPVLL